jgi:cobalt/nickel transport system permease protein
MENKIPAYLLHTKKDMIGSVKIKRSKLSFLDKTLLNTARAIKSIYLQAESSANENIFQKINPHIKLISLLYMAIVISLVSNLYAQLITSGFILLLFIFARLRIFQVYKKIFFLAFIFGFLVVMPASLNIITPGKIVYNLISFSQPYQFWIYTIPQNIGFTDNGFQVVSMVFLRVFNSVSFSMLIIFTSSFPAFVKSFKIIGVPDTFLMIISLAYKFIFILSRTIEETYFALKSRLTGHIASKNIRKLISGRIFFIFKRSVIIYEKTYQAMVSRGYQGAVTLYSPVQFGFRDILALLIIVAFGIGIILL